MISVKKLLIWDWMEPKKQMLLGLGLMVISAALIYVGIKSLP